MKIGTVKWFNQNKGYGFAQQDQGPDVFVHIRRGQKVAFQTIGSPIVLFWQQSGIIPPPKQGDKIVFYTRQTDKGLEATQWGYYDEYLKALRDQEEYQTHAKELSDKLTAEVKAKHNIIKPLPDEWLHTGEPFKPGFTKKGSDRNPVFHRGSVVKFERQGISELHNLLNYLDMLVGDYAENWNEAAGLQIRITNLRKITAYQERVFDTLLLEWLINHSQIGITDSEVHKEVMHFLKLTREGLSITFDTITFTQRLKSIEKINVFEQLAIIEGPMQLYAKKTMDGWYILPQKSIAPYIGGMINKEMNRLKYEKLPQFEVNMKIKDFTRNLLIEVVKQVESLLEKVPHTK